MSREVPPTPPEPLKPFTFDRLHIQVYEDRARMGRGASFAAAEAIRERLRESEWANVIFAAAPSQNELLAGLAAAPDIDWSRVRAFHMDEYLGLDANHPASFRRYLSEHLFGLVGLDSSRIHLIPGERVTRPMATCLAYEELLLANPVDLVCAGIGENGHLAFNDPPVADFLDPVRVKVVRLDTACRIQQVNDGCFDEIEQVPTHAYTLTIPALMAARRLIVAVPGPRKAEAVLGTLHGPISETCPASILRTHPGATLFLDRESAKLVM
jgi:glucosamine-6-phosphate deaminase